MERGSESETEKEIDKNIYTDNPQDRDEDKNNKNTEKQHYTGLQEPTYAIGNANQQNKAYNRNKTGTKWEFRYDWRSRSR